MRMFWSPGRLFGIVQDNREKFNEFRLHSHSHQVFPSGMAGTNARCISNAIDILLNYLYLGFVPRTPSTIMDLELLGLGWAGPRCVSRSEGKLCMTYSRSISI
ncbi:hypothetical protein L6164_030023 [Bauhinia variegata]|uniref:Uncharacterized protein n=1 Tax=Bauhinia variegata TaxID=167791 RepID=A0ACB9LAH4_BAUVA|nr:hypothetical protein L6164_030023 [Bauhinia variegata]